MFKEPGHLSDEEMLLILDGENPRLVARAAESHLAACWVCRSRMGELEATIKDFVSLHRRTLKPQLSDFKGPSALLRARLAEAAASPSSLSSSSFWRRPAFALACAAAFVAVLGSGLLLREPQPQKAIDVAFAERTVPDRTLTPGATRPVSLGEVCSMRHEEVVRDVPGSLRERVFQEYGITNPRPQDYEVDYLIAPGLGGTDDIRNLWPQPSTTSAWNAHRKDALEERLHQLVCHGELDLDTAQQAIATDWITAYEKYCRSDMLATAPETRRQSTAT